MTTTDAAASGGSVGRAPAANAEAARVAAALRRASAALDRRPTSGIHHDTAAEARWDGGTRTVVHHPEGARVATDMPETLGGAGSGVSPGWLFRAGLASCAATCIALAAAQRGIVLTTLSVRARSRSDTRGMLRVADPEGRPVDAGPLGAELVVRIEADGWSNADLQGLVDEALAASPVPCVVRNPTPLTVRIAATAPRRQTTVTPAGARAGSVLPG